MKLSRSWVAVFLGFAFVGVGSGCSSEEGMAGVAEPGVTKASETAIRQRLARAASLGRPDASGAWASKVAAWATNLEHAQICAALEPVRGTARVLWSTGTVVGRGGSDVVVDLGGHRAAVFTYGARGPRELLGGAAFAYQSIAFGASADGSLVSAFSGPVAPGAGADAPGFGLGEDAVSWSRAGALTGRSAIVDFVAPRTRALLTIDGSVYGEGYRASDVGTTTLASALGAIPHVMRGNAGAKEIELVAGKDGVTAGVATASTIFAHAGEKNAVAIQAAIVALALEEVRESHGGRIEAMCPSDVAPRVTPKSCSTRGGIGPCGAGDGLDLDNLLGEFPDSGSNEDTLAAATTYTGPSCINDPSLACDSLYPGQGYVCAALGNGQACCRKEIPVTKVCFADSDCSGGEICTRAKENADDGKYFTCAKPDIAACGALSIPPSTSDTPPTDNPPTWPAAGCDGSITKAESDRVYAVAQSCAASAGGVTFKTMAHGPYGVTPGTPQAEYSREWEETFSRRIGEHDRACPHGRDIVVAMGGAMVRYTKNMAEHQRVCVAQCMVNSWVKYVSGFNRIDSEVTTAMTGKGQCGGFAALLVALAQSTGVRAYTEATTNFNNGAEAHAYNRIVFADGRRVWFEPQNPNNNPNACVFKE